MGVKKSKEKAPPEERYTLFINEFHPLVLVVASMPSDAEGFGPFFAPSRSWRSINATDTPQDGPEGDAGCGVVEAIRVWRR